MKRGFGSDNHSGISPEILQAIAAANTDHALAYGGGDGRQDLRADARVVVTSKSSLHLSIV